MAVCGDLDDVGLQRRIAKTPLGKVIGRMVAVAGFGLVALPTGFLALGFSKAVQRDRAAH